MGNDKDQFSQQSFGKLLSKLFLTVVILRLKLHSLSYRWKTLYFAELQPQGTDEIHDPYLKEDW